LVRRISITSGALISNLFTGISEMLTGIETFPPLAVEDRPAVTFSGVRVPGDDAPRPGGQEEQCKKEKGNLFHSSSVVGMEAHPRRILNDLAPKQYCMIS
jgi:hypothetical protein